MFSGEAFKASAVPWYSWGLFLDQSNKVITERFIVVLKKTFIKSYAKQIQNLYVRTACMHKKVGIKGPSTDFTGQA